MKSAMGDSSSFQLHAYDCIGFDLDNTLVQYDIPRMSQLVYKILANFLVRKYAYPSEGISLVEENNMEFVQKGLALDFSNGNIVKLGETGFVMQACHGTRFLTSDEIKLVYGNDGVWNYGRLYGKGILQSWNGEMSERIRCVLDSFDTPCILLYAKTIDLIDSRALAYRYQEAWSHILDGLNYMYDKQGFATNTGEFFPALKENPCYYIKSRSDKTIEWLKALRNMGKVIFLITGSAVDFATFTASHALGAEWQEFFDIIIYFARKPNFFVGNRPFLNVDNFQETDVCDNISNVKVLSQGNFADLKSELARRSKCNSPKVLYIGDNLVQDVFAPVHVGCSDAIAISEELSSNPSRVWGSYFEDADGNYSFWKRLIENNAKMCVPSVDSLAHSFEKSLNTVMM